MARPSKLTAAQCAQFRTMRTDSNPKKHYTMAQLCQRFGVSESSGYKIMDGSYVARPDDKHTVRATPKLPIPAAPTLPLHLAEVPPGHTPSLFQPERRKNNVFQMAQFRAGDDVDELTLCAAQLLVARSRFAQALRAA